MGIRDALRAAAGWVRSPPTRLGPHPIGRRGQDLIGVDGERIHIEWFHPSRRGAVGEPVPLFSEPLRQAMHTHMRVPLAMLPAKATAAGQRGVPIADGRHPALLFMHGFASFSLQNRRMLEMLASHGWIAGSLSLPKDSLVTVFEDGHSVELDTDAPAVKALRQMNDQAEAFATELHEGLSRMRTADDAHTFMAALDHLSAQPIFGLYQPVAERMAGALERTLSALDTSEHPVPQAIDPGRLALIGHSLGGAAAIATAQRRFRAGRPVQAAINLDGASFLHDGALDLGTPAAFFHAHASRVGGQTFSNERVNTGWLTHGENVGISIECARAAHAGFTDLAFNPAAQAMGAVGSIDGPAFATWMHEAAHAFLQTHVNGDLHSLPAHDAVDILPHP